MNKGGKESKADRKEEEIKDKKKFQKSTVHSAQKKRGESVCD
jgi:hypothetical protein